VQSKPLSGAVSASARLTLRQEGVARTAARVSGRVEAIRVRLGERVKKGQVLGMIESAELGQTRADYLAASAKVRVAQSNHQQEKQLVEKGISAERELREAEGALAVANGELDAADARLHAFGLSEGEIKSLKAQEHYSSEFAIRSPIDGTVIELLVTVGQSVEGTTHLFTVGELSELWAILDIFEKQLPYVHVGQEVELTLEAVPGERFLGRVDYIADLVEEKSRTIEVRVVVPNRGEGRRLKPGMFATALIKTEGPTDGGAVDSLVVPREAVQRVRGEDLVFVPEDGFAGPGPAFRAVEVELGESTATEVEVKRGLTRGQKIVVRGAFILKSELAKDSLGEGHSH
jgi:membrane fusion protein, heavy metal efflux system